MTTAPALPVAAIEDVRRLADAAFADFGPIHAAYNRAFEFAIPNASPQNSVDGTTGAREVYDITGTISTLTGAAQLRTDLFPVGFFDLKVGPLAAMAMTPAEVETANADLSKRAEMLHALIRTPAFLLAWDVTCVDLYNGSGVQFIGAGTMAKPFRFVPLPATQCAFVGDGAGGIKGVYHRCEMAAGDVLDEWADGKFDVAFREATKKDDRAKVRVTQAFRRIGAGPRWRLDVDVAGNEAIVYSEAYDVQPVVVARYWLRPGDVAGRGPLQMALPAMEVANTVQELVLRFGSITLGGIWGFRPLEFNPKQADFRPGAWWPMTSTGGVMGPSVSQLNNPNARLDFSQLVLNEIREQIRAALHDDQLEGKGLTPKSAAEVVAKLEKIALKAQGGHMRVTSEAYGVIVRRCISILKGLGLPFDVPHIDDVMVQIDVVTPIAQAQAAHLVAGIVQFLTILREVVPDELDVHIKIDEALGRIAAGLMVPASLLPTTAEKQETRARKVKAQAEAAMAAMAMQGGQTAATGGAA